MRARDRRLPDGGLGPAALSGVGAVLVLLGALLSGYLGIAGFVWLIQERLLFYPQPVRTAPRAPDGWSFEQVRLTAADGAVLAGVLVRPEASRTPVVVYFGGNAEEVTAGAQGAAHDYGKRAVLLMNYRGYGASSGKPTEAALVSDGIEIVKWARLRGDLDGQRVALHGRSLGAGVAVQVAAATAPACVVLTSPFDSALEVARSFYPWLPVGLLLRHRFDSMAHAPRLTMPVLVLAGEADTLIAAERSRRLAQRWAGPSTYVELPGMGHGDLSIHPRYVESLRQFLDARL